MDSLVSTPEGATVEQLRLATLLLERLADDWTLFDQLPPDDRARLRRAIARAHEPDRGARRRRARNRRADTVRRDERTLHETGIRALRRRPVFTTPNVFPPETPVAGVARRGYARVLHLQGGVYAHSPLLRSAVSRVRRVQLHEAHRARRSERPRRAAHRRPREDRLPGRPQAAAMPAHGSSSPPASRGTRASRYAQEPDFDEWKDRLEIAGLDLRHTPSVEAFCRELVTTRERLDFIVNNACQTVRRPPEFYAHMMAEERPSDMPEPHAAAWRRSPARAGWRVSQCRRTA